MYLSFALFCEGHTDHAYLDVLIPKVINEILMDEGVRLIDVAEQPALRLGRLGRQVETVAKEACDGSKAFHLVFVHADTGGRALERALNERGCAYCCAMKELCDWPCERCIVIAPRHETEAWVMLDENAISDVLGYRGNLQALGLPRTASAIEGLIDPKGLLEQIIASVRKRRRAESAEELFPAIGGRQSIPKLRRARSFKTFEQKLRIALRTLGCIPQNN